MKKIIEFDTKTDTYEDVLARVKAAYGLRAWSQPDVDLWISLMTEEQVAFVSLLARSARRSIRKDEAKSALGYSIEDKRCLANLSIGINRAARSGPHQPSPIEFVQSSSLYSLDPPVAKLVLHALSHSG